MFTFGSESSHACLHRPHSTVAAVAMIKQECSCPLTKTPILGTDLQYIQIHQEHSKPQQLRHDSSTLQISFTLLCCLSSLHHHHSSAFLSLPSNTTEDARVLVISRSALRVHMHAQPTTQPKNTHLKMIVERRIRPCAFHVRKETRPREG